MHAQIAERSTSRVVADVKAAPGRHAAPAQRRRLCVVHIAELARIGNFFGGQRPVGKAARLRDKEDAGALLCALEHLYGIGVARGNGLFTKYVRAGFKRRQRVFFVRHVGRAHASDIRLHFGQHFRAVVVGVRDIVARRRLLGPLYAAIKDGYDFGIVSAAFPSGGYDRRWRSYPHRLRRLSSVFQT